MDDVEAEVDGVQTGALLVALELVTLTVTGKDRLTWLNGLVTCELANRRIGDACFGLAVQKTGKISAELWFAIEQDQVHLGVRADRAAAVRESFDRHLVMEDAEISEPQQGREWLWALGPSAPEVVQTASAQGAFAAPLVRRGVPGALLCVESAQRDALLAALRTSASPCLVASSAGWERVRVEHGFPRWGVDFDQENYPQEASLEADGVSFQKGCYLGQEAVFMLEKRGHVKKRLVQLLVAGPVAVGDVISAAGAEVGRVTSVARRAGGNLALGYVKYKHSKAEAELVAGQSSARVTKLLALDVEA